MNYRLGFFILAIILGGLISYIIFKPKEVDNSYVLQELKESRERESKLISELNKLKPLKDEQKEFRSNVDSIYTDLSKDSLRARIRYNMLTDKNR